MNTEIIVITDRSGSMQNRVNDVIGGFNNFIMEQTKIEGAARVTFAQFDDVYEIVYAGRDLREVPPLTGETFVPRGSTALLDAIGRTLEEQGSRIHKDKWAQLVVVVIITDGGENASRHFSRQRVTEMVRHAEKFGGWSFVYLGANQDAFAEAANLGINVHSFRNNTMTFADTKHGFTQAYGAATMSTSQLRSGGTAREEDKKP